MQETNDATDLNRNETTDGNNKTIQNINNNVSVLNLLQSVCASPTQTINHGIVPNNANALVENAVKHLLQLTTNSAALKGAASPKNGVKTCSCIVHLVLLQVRWNFCFFFVVVYFFWGGLQT